VLCRVAASRHWRVEKGHIGTLGIHQVRDALDSGHADGAHLDPDRTRSERSEHALVAGDRNDGIGVAHHRDDDRGSVGGVGGGFGDFRAKVGEISSRSWVAVPNDCPDACT
jgi:hypothetical protein